MCGCARPTQLTSTHVRKGKVVIVGTLQNSTKPSRRGFLAGAGALGAAALVTGCSSGTPVPPPTTGGGKPTYVDADYLTFALNLEYLEAEFYLRAATGSGLSATDAGSGASTVTGGTAVPFTSTVVQQYAVEIAQNELNHVRFLRSALGSGVISRPAIDFTNAFTGAAIAAGVIASGATFNPFADQTSFLLGAFIFEDVGVTAYTGAAPLLTSKTLLSAAAGIQAVEAYHAAEIRTIIANTGGSALAAANMISALRGTLGGGGETPISTGITMANGATTVGPSSIVAADGNALAYARTTDQVLHIVYATGGGSGVKSGGFFPSGLNGNISVTTS